MRVRVCRRVGGVAGTQRNRRRRAKHLASQNGKGRAWQQQREGRQGYWESQRQGIEGRKETKGRDATRSQSGVADKAAGQGLDGINERVQGPGERNSLSQVLQTGRQCEGKVGEVRAN